MKISNIQTPSFKAMKPNQFKGFEYACVRKFKAPVEKFKTKNNFYLWALDKLSSLIKAKNIAGKNHFTKLQRQDLIIEWRQALGYSCTSAPLALIALSSLLKELKTDNDKLPPVFSAEVLKNTITEIQSELEKNKDFQFNFKEIYTQNLRKKYLENEKSDFTGWVKIPSIKNDPQNYDENLTKLKIFSNKTWCTKSSTADTLLKYGDLHIWLEAGEPKIALRFNDNLLIEIQNSKNNGELSINEFDIIEDYIIKNKFPMDGKALESYHDIKAIATTLKQINIDLKSAIEENNSFKIFEYFDFEPEILPDKSLSINEYRYPIEDFSFNDLGIDEKKLFKNVSEIRGDADFKGSKLTKLENIKRILGDADFYDSQIMDLGSLEIILGDANFSRSGITSTKQLRYIGKSGKFNDSLIRSLENIEFVGGNLYLNQWLSSLGKLKYIGGDAHLDYYSSPLENIEEIGGDAFFGAGIKGLGKLHTIKGNAYFTYCNLTTLGELKTIGGIFYPSKTMKPEDYANVNYSNIET